MENASKGKEVVLVTGGNGLIGTAVCERLADRYEVVSLDVKEPSRRTQNVHFARMDVSSRAGVAKALDQIRTRYGGRIASVVHLAAYYSFSGDPSPRYDQITVNGTQNLLEELKARFTVEQFIFSSTILVHAPCEPGQKIDESWPLDPKWPYPRSKVDAEARIRSRHGEIPYVVLRIAGVYDDSCHSLPIAHQIERINEFHLTSHFYPGQLSIGQSFVHLEDLVSAIERAVIRRNELPKELSLLIGEPEVLSYREMQDRLGRLIHGEQRVPEHWRTLKIPKPAAKAGAWVQSRMPIGEEPFIKSFMVDMADDHYDLDVSRARRYLGWNPRHRLADTLPRMVELLKRNPDLFYRQNRLSEPNAAAVMLRRNILAVLAGIAIIGPVGILIAKRVRSRPRALRFRRAPGERMFRRAG